MIQPNIITYPSKENIIVKVNNSEFWVGQAIPVTHTCHELEQFFKEPEPELKKSAKALRFDSGKTNWSLMPFEAVEEINKVLEFGANKYAAWNFTKDGGMNHSRILNSCVRHIFSYMRGQDCDPESGLSHLAHAGCNILFLLYYKKYPLVFTKDDRHVR